MARLENLEKAIKMIKKKTKIVRIKEEIYLGSNAWGRTASRLAIGWYVYFKTPSGNIDKVYVPEEGTLQDVKRKLSLYF